MLNTTEYIAETTDLPLASNVIDDALRALRVTGTLLLRESYTAPWGIDIPAGEKLAALLQTAADAQVVAFHLVEFGHCQAGSAGDAERLLQGGEISIWFGGQAHRLSLGQGYHPQPIEALLAGGPNIQRGPVDQADTRLICGVFVLHNTALNPLLAALPPLLHTSLSRPGQWRNLAGVAGMLSEEIESPSVGGGYVVERLLEVLCADAIRGHIARLPKSEANWLRGVTDPVAGRAIAAVHAEPGANWSVPRLAAGVAMSPSRFAARFSAAVGQSPMAYVSQWRLHLACRALTDTRQSLDQIAAGIGYESVASFSRAFKKHVGTAPSQWRSERQLHAQQ